MNKREHFIPFLLTFLIFLIVQLPFFDVVQYPFRLLGTWFHEMGHGIASLLLGGKFVYLEIYKNGGGVAYTDVSNSYLPYRLARAITAAGGLIGTTIGGTICIVVSKYNITAVYVLRVLFFLMVLSLFLWIRSFWGVFLLSVFAIAIAGILKFTNKSFQKSTLLFLGLQAILSSYYESGYVFTKQFERFGQINYSDTEIIAQNTFGPYWFWGILITMLNVCIVWKAIVLSFHYKKE